MSISELDQFNLVGGTALSLRYGHRLSIDLDLFSETNFINDDVIAILEKHFPSFVYQNANNPIGVFGFIDNVKVDFVKHYHHPLIDKIEVEEKIRIVSDKDIVAMKINAVLRRAVKKDFWDLAELFKHYSLKDCIAFYNAKFKNQQLAVSIPRAVTFFDDAEDSEDPISLKGQTWKAVKKSIQKKVNEYMK